MLWTLPSVLWHCWLGGRKGIRPVKKTEWWGAGMVICLERDADLHMAQLMPLPLTVCCFSKIQIDFTFLIPAHPGSPGHRAIKQVCVCVCVNCGGCCGIFISPLPVDRGMEYCDEHVCLCVCLFTIISPEILARSTPNFFAHGHGSILLRCYEWSHNLHIS